MKYKILRIALALLILNPTNTVLAKQSTDANPWGYSGLINMPTANTLGFGEFYINGNYLARNPGFTANAYMGIFDRLELGIVGGIPSAGFSGLAGNLKYQLIKPSAKMPTSLAVGLSLIGLAQNTKLTTGNNLYMVLSHDFNWQLADKSLYNLFSGHVGFNGNFDGARIMAGLDIPVTEYANINAEYLGKVSSFDEMINFGVKVKPLSWLSVSFLTIGTSTKGFANTEYLFNLSYNGKIPFMQLSQNQDDDKVVIVTEPKITPKPIPTPVIKVTVPTPIPTVLPTPKAQPTIIPTPVIKETPKIVVEPKTVLTILPTPKIEATPTPLPKPKITAEPVKEQKYGILKGDIKGAFGGLKPENVQINLKSLKGNIEKSKKSDKEGNYSFSDLPKGDYSVSFEKEGFIQIKRQIFINNGDTTEVNIEMTATNGALSGRVLDNKGKPLSEIALALDKGRKTLTEKNGKFNFEDIKAGYHLLSVYSAGNEVKSFDIDIIAGTELTKEIILDSNIKKTIIKKEIVKVVPKTDTIKNKPRVTNKDSVNPVIKDKPLRDGLAGIAGKISDKNGLLKGARVMFEGDKLTVMTISGADGNYTVKNIPLGTYKMTISKSGYVTRVFSVKIKDAKQAKHDVKLNLE